MMSMLFPWLFVWLVFGLAFCFCCVPIQERLQPIAPMKRMAGRRKIAVMGLRFLRFVGLLVPASLIVV